MIRRLLGCACALALLASSSARAAEPPRAISQLTERLYVVSAGEQSTVALVTSGGILIADPLDAATAAWLRTELSTRFPGVPVRYVVLTSAEFGRTSGVTTFLPGAALLAHAGINGALVKASQTLPPELVAIDANRDGRLERSEWISTELSALLSNADGDNDGTLTPRELWKLIPYATETFRDDRLLTLGNDTVRLVDPGGDVSTAAIFFPSDRVLYSGSNPLVMASGFTLTLAGRTRTFAWLDGVSRLQFDRIITSRGDTVTRADFDAVVRYAHALDQAAIEAYRRGQSEDGALRSPALAGFASAPGRRADVSAIFSTLNRWRVDVHAAAFGRRIPKRSAYCESFEPCVSGAEVRGAGGGVRVVRSRIGAIFELNYSDQFIQTRNSLLMDEAYAHRSSRGSLLFRYGGSRPKGLSFDLVAGPTWVVGDTQGADRVRERVAPSGGRHAFSDHSTQTGWTAGANLVLPVVYGVSVVLPVRVTHVMPPSLTTWPNGTDLQIGVGMSLRVFERVR